MADLIVDGSYLLHRALKGSPDVRLLKTSSGKPSGGAFSFLRSLRGTLLKFREVDRVIVVFDTGRSPRRQKLYPEYKANRKVDDTPDDNGWTYPDILNAQVRILRFLLPKLSVRIVTLPRREGDDLLWLIPQLLNSILTVIMTDDKDMLQLVSQNIHIWRPMAQDYVTPEDFEEVAGCPLEYFLLRKAIVGDSSDNIIGVKGVGPKTAMKFISECPHVGEYPFHDFFDYLLDLDVPRAEAIYDHEDEVLRNYRLLDLSAEEFTDDDKASVLDACTSPLSLDVVAAMKALKALEYFSLLDDFSNWVVRFQLLR